MFRIREITYAKNCVFHCVHKEIDNAFSPGDNYSFHESDLQITLRLLSSSLGNTDSSFAYVISRIRNTNRPKKKLDNVFQSNCSSHAELLTNLRKIEKRPKIRHKAVMHPALHIMLHHQQDTPEIELAVYQEMWFPVAVVAGMTVILIFLAIVCLVSYSIPSRNLFTQGYYTVIAS